MSAKLEAILKDGKSYIGLLVGLFGVLNNYLHVFMPLAPSLRLQTNVVLILLGVIVIGITVHLIHEKNSLGLKRWARRVGGIWAIVGFVAWGAYMPILHFLENHSHTQIASDWFDAVQTGAYVFPFLAWIIAITALSSLFL